MYEELPGFRLGPALAHGTGRGVGDPGARTVAKLVVDAARRRDHPPPDRDGALHFVEPRVTRVLAGRRYWRPVLKAPRISNLN